MRLPEYELASFTDDVATYHQSFGTDFWRLLWTAVRVLATGTPVEPERLAALAGLSLDRTVTIAREAWEWDASGERLVGAGLTFDQTRYRVDIEGCTMWTYCAPDTLELPVILDKAVRAQSVCAATGDRIDVFTTPTTVQTIDPPSTVVSFPDPSSPPRLADLRRMGCHQASFYRDADAGAEWLSTHPRGRLLAVEDAHSVLRTSMLRLRHRFSQAAGDP